MLFKIFLYGLLVTFTVAKSPKIQGFSGEQKVRIQDGFDDAMKMARTVRTAPAHTVEAVLQKWFQPSDKAKVLGKLFNDCLTTAQC